MQVDPIKPTMKAPGDKRLKQKNKRQVSNFAFKFNLRRYTLAFSAAWHFKEIPAGLGVAAGAYTRTLFSST